VTWSIEDVLNATHGHFVSGSKDIVFRGISTDSRDIKSGDLFVALKGRNYDAHAFVLDAFQRGALGAMVMDRSRHYKGTVIGVDDTLTALGDLAAYIRNKHSIAVVGITGSSGKTTVKEFCASILSLVGTCLKTEKNYNNLIGVPLTLLKLRSEHKFAVIEMGTNRPGEIDRLSSIARPDISAITNITPAHLNGLKSISGVIEEKQAIFRNTDKSGFAVFNPLLDNMDRIYIPRELNRITFSLSDKTDVRAEKIISEDFHGTNLIADLAGRMIRIKVGLPGKHNVTNALAACACAMALNIDADTIGAGIEKTSLPGGRLDITVSDSLTIIDDTYNANPASMKVALDMIDAFPHIYKVAVLGDMLELGNDSIYWHEQLGRWVASSSVNRLIVAGGFARIVLDTAIREGMDGSSVFMVKDMEEVKSLTAEYIGRDAVILVKASRALQLDKVVSYLKAVA